MPGNTIMSHAVIPKQQYQKHQLHPVSASLLRDKHIILKPKANRGGLIFTDIQLSLDCSKTGGPRIGNTTLILASDAGHVEVVRELVKNKWVDVNVKNDEGSTALSLARKKGHQNF